MIGKRKYQQRKYQLSEALGIDQYNLRTLRALKTKLVRDYLTFFGTLSGLYQGTKQKKDINNSTIKVNQTIALIDSILEGGVVGKKDVDKLLLLIDNINIDRDHFLQKASEVRAFSDRIARVAEETGISIEDLNITRDIAARVGMQTRKAQREGVTSSLRKTMPEMFRLGGGVARGVGTALVGPFAPLLGPMAAGVFGLGKGLVRGIQRRREVGLAEQLRPVAGGISSAFGERISRARGQESVVTGALSRATGQEPIIGRRRSQEDLVRPLMYFFDRKAYRAKWTKELLGKIKNLEGGKGGLGGLFGGLFGGLAGKLKSLLPIIGALGKIGALGAAITFAAVKLYELADVTKGYFDVRKNVKRFEEKQKGFLERGLRKAVGLTMFGDTDEERQAGRRARKVYQKALQKEFEREAKRWGPSLLTWDSWKQGVAGLISQGREKLGMKPTIDLEIPEVSTPISSIPRGRELGVEELRDIMRDTEKRGQELQRSIDRLADSIDKEKSVPNIRNRGYGNPYDSADTLLGMRASGELTIDER